MLLCLCYSVMLSLFLLCVGKIVCCLSFVLWLWWFALLCFALVVCCRVVLCVCPVLVSVAV